MQQRVGMAAIVVERRVVMAPRVLQHAWRHHDAPLDHYRRHADALLHAVSIDYRRNRDAFVARLFASALPGENRMSSTPAGDVPTAGKPLVVGGSPFVLGGCQDLRGEVIMH
ncbi:hypothetical protein CF640_36550, partial [Burkholderia pseudomallei]